MIIPVASWWKSYWNLFILVLILFNSILLPIQLCFYAYDENVFDNFDYITLVIFWVDIFLNSRTTFFNDNNEEVVSGKKIAGKYFTSTHFYIDFLSAMPLKLFVTDAVWNV